MISERAGAPSRFVASAKQARACDETPKLSPPRAADELLARRAELVGAVENSTARAGAPRPPRSRRELAGQVKGDSSAGATGGGTFLTPI